MTDTATAVNPTPQAAVKVPSSVYADLAGDLDRVTRKYLPRNWTPGTTFSGWIIDEEQHTTDCACAGCKILGALDYLHSDALVAQQEARRS